MNKFSRILLALLLTCTVSSATAAETPKGDVNGDTKVTIADVTALVNIILGKVPPESDSTDIDDEEPAWEPAQAPKRGGNDGNDSGSNSRRPSRH